MFEHPSAESALKIWKWAQDVKKKEFGKRNKR